MRGKLKKRLSKKHFDRQADAKERQINANKQVADKLNSKGFNSEQYFNRDMIPQERDFEEGVDKNIIDGFKHFTAGVYEINGVSTGNALKDKQILDEHYGISKFIDNTPSKHLNDNPTLYRGAVMNDQEFKALQSGSVDIKDLQGLTSWSTREMVAHMYAQESDMVWGGARGDKRVVFIDSSSTNDGVPNPYTYPANEVLRSSSIKYQVEKIVDVSEYTTAKGRENDGKSQYQKPVYYVYVKRKRG